MLGYKDLALADVDPPIVVIAPDFTALEPNYRIALKLSGESDVIQHASRLFARSFSTVQELADFLKQFADDRQLSASVVDSERFLFDIEWPRAANEQLERYKQEVQPQMSSNPWGSSSELVYDAFLGRMMQTNDALFRSERYGGTPLIDAPTSWQYLLWKYEYDAKESTLRAGTRDLVISKAVEVEGTPKIDFLEGVPPEALVELRRRGALADLRETIRSGIDEIDLASREAVAEVSKHVIANLDAAFARHEQQLRALSSSKSKFFGIDVGRWIGFGGISIAAALTGNLSLGVLTAVSGMVGAPGIADLQKRWRDLKSRSDTLKRSPTGILFQHLKHKFGFA